MTEGNEVMTLGNALTTGGSKKACASRFLATVIMTGYVAACGCSDRTDLEKTQGLPAMNRLPERSIKLRLSRRHARNDDGHLIVGIEVKNETGEDVLWDTDFGVFCNWSVTSAD